MVPRDCLLFCAIEIRYLLTYLHHFQELLQLHNPLHLFLSTERLYHFPTDAVQAAVLYGSTNILSAKAAFVLRKVAEGLRFDCSQCDSFTVFAVYLRFSAVVEPQGIAA